jgi:hypothetical protein
MKRIVIVAALLLSAIVHADAKARPNVVKRTGNTGVTVYNRDSRDPGIRWHTENGMRVCRRDCDNPEIPGSGAVCRNVNVMGMPMRECVTGSPL